MKIAYSQVGICGLSCRLCPSFNTEAASRCLGCKSPDRMALGCPFITCAVKKKELEFCWDCKESGACPKWLAHRESGKHKDSFKCYQTLETDIVFIQTNGIDAFEKTQQEKAVLLSEMLHEFGDGRSKSYYCIAVTVLDIQTLSTALSRAREESAGLDAKSKAKVLHTILDEIAAQKKLVLKLRR